MRAVHWIVAALTVLAVGAFMARVGAPNVIGSGTAQTEKTAVSQLRTMHWAEGLFLRGTYADEDGDGAGEFGTVAQLASIEPARKPLPVPILQVNGARWHGGVLEAGGYCFRVALSATIDARERGFLAYAWPAQADRPAKAFCLDQDEVIRETKAPHTYVGCARPPPDDACAGDAWGPWKNKKSKKSAGG